MAQACNPSTLEVGAGSNIQGQPWILSSSPAQYKYKWNLTQKKKKDRRKERTKKEEKKENLLKRLDVFASYYSKDCGFSVYSPIFSSPILPPKRFPSFLAFQVSTGAWEILCRVEKCFWLDLRSEGGRWGGRRRGGACEMEWGRDFKMHLRFK